MTLIWEKVLDYIRTASVIIWTFDRQAYNHIMLESLVLDTDSTRVCVREEYSSRVGLHKGSICFFTQNLLNPFFFFFCFCIWLLSVLRGHSFFSSPPQRPMTSWLLNPRFDILLFYLSSWERANISQSMLSAKQENYWYYFYNVFGMTRSLTGDWTWDLLHSKQDRAFITSLVWCPRLRIEPRTPHTWSQHSTTRLSRRGFFFFTPWFGLFTWELN